MSKSGTIILNGDKESRSTTVRDNLVLVHHVTKHKSEQNIVCDWTFDFDGVSDDELKRLASRSLVIDARSAFKGIDEKDIEMEADQTFNVKEMTTKQRRGKSPGQKVAKLLEGMSSEQVQEALKNAGISL